MAEAKSRRTRQLGERRRSVGISRLDASPQSSRLIHMSEGRRLTSGIAAEMADRFNRLFLRTLRQLRDLRRYSIPGMINNPEQGNIAAKGGPQVNVNAKGAQEAQLSLS